MSNSEIKKTFDEQREVLKPYGLTCEIWTPSPMRKPDRHNEIEINYFMDGSMTYLFQGNAITIPPKRLAIFWGLVPHQIIHSDTLAPYYVCTIPFSQFLAWKLPQAFVDRVLKGEVIVESNESYSVYDEFQLTNWINEITNIKVTDLILLEMQARINRLALHHLTEDAGSQSPVRQKEVSKVEKMAMFIAQNYSNQVKVADIGEAVDMHPDYANTLFKKAFGRTLNEYLIEQRVAHAQRKLVATDTGITQIAFDCGFNSISRFNAAFRKINRCTPREYRKKFT